MPAFERQKKTRRGVFEDGPLHGTKTHMVQDACGTKVETEQDGIVGLAAPFIIRPFTVRSNFISTQLWI